MSSWAGRTALEKCFSSGRLPVVVLNYFEMRHHNLHALARLGSKFEVACTMEDTCRCLYDKKGFPPEKKNVPEKKLIFKNVYVHFPIQLSGNQPRENNFFLDSGHECQHVLPSGKTAFFCSVYEMKHGANIQLLRVFHLNLFSHS